MVHVPIADQYVGCFIDQEPRVLGLVINETIKGLYRCINVCGDEGKTFFGVEVCQALKSMHAYPDNVHITSV